MAKAHSTMQAWRAWRVVFTALAAGMLLALFGMTAQAQAQDDAAGRGGEGKEVYGRIDAMPAAGLVGQWTVDGDNYTATAETEFDQSQGAFAVGVCVKVHLKPDGVTVREMDSEPDSDCDGSNGGGGNGGGDDDGREFYGLVETMPISGFAGSWTISGGVYTVTEQTEIKQRFGPIEVGACVEVELTADESAVRELQSKRTAYCTGDDNGGDNGGGNQGHGELYAELVSFPPELVGVWQIGTITMTADANTEFQQKNGAFTAGEFVKAEFTILADGTFYAREIKTIGDARGDDDDDGPGHDHGHDRDHDGKAFGLIEFVPEGNIGVWQIGGISYTVTISTELNDHKGALTVGQNVKVEYRTDDEGNRTATEIKAMPAGAGGDKDLLKLVGYVQAMPSDGFVGNWTVGDVEFVADASSRFEEECGILDVGAFVEVKYVMQDGARLIVKLETHVPPGGGDDDHMGRVERMDDSVLAATTGAAAATWTIGGRSYVVNDATAVGSSVAVGSNALVNSYKAADGSQVATSISSVTLDHMLYLPAAMK